MFIETSAFVKWKSEHNSEIQWQKKKTAENVLFQCVFIINNGHSVINNNKNTVEGSFILCLVVNKYDTLHHPIGSKTVDSLQDCVVILPVVDIPY